MLLNMGVNPAGAARSMRVLEALAAALQLTPLDVRQT